MPVFAETVMTHIRRFGVAVLTVLLGGLSLTAATVQLDPASRHRLLWATPIPDAPGVLMSDPVLAGDTVWLASSNMTMGDLRAQRFDIGTGQLLGEATIAQSPGSGGGGAMGPQSDVARLFFRTSDEAYALAAADGSVVWRKGLQGGGIGPTVAGDLVITQTNRSYVALDARTGTTRWRSDPVEPENRHIHAPIVVTIDGTPFVVVSEESRVSVMRADDGRVMARLPGRFDGLLTAGGRHVYVRSGGDGVVAIGLATEGSAVDARKTWSFKADSMVTNALVVNDDLYVLSRRHVLSCVDGSTGRVYWSQQIEAANGSGRLAAMNGRLYVLDRQGYATVIQASRAFEVINRFRMTAPWQTAAIVTSGDSLLVRTDAYLARIEPV